MALFRYQRALVSLLVSSVAAQQTVKVDDGNVYSLSNRNGIQFGSSGWSTDNPRNADQRYQGTYTSSQAANTHLIFFFRGTGISHYADEWNGSGPAGVSIDGQPYQNYTWTNVDPTVFLYQQQMWSITGLSLGDHQVVISNVGTGDPNSSYMGVDYLEVTPGPDGSIIPTETGPGASNIPSNAVLVDDTSDQVSYAGSWEQFNSGPNIALYLGGSQHSSSSSGAVATFKFTGTAIWYFSDQVSGNAVVGVSVDGGPEEPVDTSISPGTSLTQILMWSKTDLTPGPHTLVITNRGDGNQYINVDFFIYLPSANVPAATSSSSVASIPVVISQSASTQTVTVIAQPTTSSQATTPTTTSHPTTSAAVAGSGSNSNSASDPSSTPIGAIVGGVVGGVAVLALIAGLLIWKSRGKPAPGPAGPVHESYGEAGYAGKEAYGQPGSPNAPGTPGFGPEVGYQYQQGQGMPLPQTQNVGGPQSITPTAWTGATYSGHPEIQ